MRPLALIRKVFGILKSQGSPTQIGLGFCVGMLLGLTPIGWHSLVVLSLAAVFNLSLGAVSLGFGLFKLLYFVVRPWTYQLGFAALEGWRQLNPVLAEVLRWPILAWTELNQYLVFGGYLAALAASLLLFPAVVWGVRRYRASYGQRIRSERLKRLGQTWYGKLLRWVAVAGEARFLEAKRRPWPLRVVRWQALIVLPLLLVAVYVITATTMPFFAEQLVTRPTALILNTEVGVARATYQPFSGKVTLEGFNVVDPKNPDENLLVVGAATLDIGLVGLMQRRAVINQASFEALELHVKREADGSLNLDNVGGGWDVEGYLDWVAEHGGKVDWIGLINKLVEYWHTLPPRPRPEPRPDLGGAHPLARKTSWFRLERVGAQRVHVTLVDEFGRSGALPALSQAELLIENLELPPRYASQPVSITLKGGFRQLPGATLEVVVRFEPKGKGAFDTLLGFHIRGLDLVPFAPLYERGLPLRLVQGVLGLSGLLTLSDGALSGEAELELVGLNIERKPGHPSLFGLDPLTSGYVVQGINRFAQAAPIAFNFTVSGTRQAPRVDWDAAFIDVAIQGLEMQANLLLRPILELLKHHLEGLGFDGASLDAEAGLGALGDVLKGLFGGGQQD